MKQNSKDPTSLPACLLWAVTVN